MLALRAKIGLFIRSTSCSIKQVIYRGVPRCAVDGAWARLEKFQYLKYGEQSVVGWAALGRGSGVNPSYDCGGTYILQSKLEV